MEERDVAQIAEGSQKRKTKLRIWTTFATIVSLAPFISDNFWTVCYRRWTRKVAC